VVQPRHAAFPEVLGLTGGGVLCEPDDAGSLATNLARLIEDEAANQHLGREGREQVLARFDLSHMTDRVLDVYRALVPHTAITGERPHE
jgi:glycosyltransferase involved in cell wall biosynthesis